MIATRPELFTSDGRVRTDRWNACYAAVVDELRAVGYCAVFDGEEVAIKNTNAFNEQYHVLTSASTVRRGDGSYRATCRPVWF